MVSPNLVDLATVVGGFSAALATLFAIFAVPVALWQVAQSRRASYVDLFYAQSDHLFDCAEALLETVATEYKEYVGRDQSQEDFLSPGVLVQFNTAWDRYQNCVRRLLAAYDRAGGDINVEHLDAVWQVTHSLAFALGDYVDEHPETTPTSEFGMFLYCLSEARDGCEEICADKRVAAGAAHAQENPGGGNK